MQGCKALKEKNWSTLGPSSKLPGSTTSEATRRAARAIFFCMIGLTKSVSNKSKSQEGRRDVLGNGKKCLDSNVDGTFQLLSRFCKGGDYGGCKHKIREEIFEVVRIYL